MNLRTLCLLFTVLLASIAGLGRAFTSTPAETQALHAAAGDHTSYTLPPAKLQQAKSLYRARTTLHFTGEAWAILQLLLLLALRIPPRIRDLAERITRQRWLQGCLFVFAFLLLTTLLNLPLRLYGHHVALAFGLSVQGWTSWSFDQCKSFLLSAAVASLLVLVLFWIIRRSPTRWWFWFWIPTMAAVLFGVFLSPILVDPLFNRFEPLQQHDPALVTQLERVAQRSGVVLPPDRMFLMRASQKVTSLNAYVTGFGPSKRLVLWDTTIAASTPDELSAIFGHELGHYALDHIQLGLGFTAVLLLVGFYAGQRIVPWLLRVRGGRWQIRSVDDWACLAVLLLVLQILTFASEPLDNAFSRALEHNADIYGQEAIHGIVADPQAATVSSFQKLGEVSLDDPTPHPFVDLWTSSHPSIAERAAFAAAYNPWIHGLHPKYF